MWDRRKFLAFTLVELIIVITIVGILSTVWFVSYTSYLSWARDSNRISQLSKISDALQVYSTSKRLPLPDNKIDITASWASNIVSYQWVVWVEVLETIDYTGWWLDPKDDSYFTYFLNKDRRSFQLMGFLEDREALAYNTSKSLLAWISTNSAQANDYENRFPIVYWKKLWVLLSWEESIFNTPAQEIAANQLSGSVDIYLSPQTYISLLSNNGESFISIGYWLWALMSTRLWQEAPNNCPSGFIWVPGNPEFGTQEGFCVAQYEMSYADADTPNTTIGGTDWNTVAYVPWKQIVSMAGKYPITYITQIEAIAACESMGPGYHLITNNEWMTIARSIESNRDNWSSWTIGVWNIYNWVSNNTTLGCDAIGGNTESRAFATKTWPWDINCNQRRSHVLWQGWGIIWDLSGNVWEHVNKANSIDGIWFNSGQTTVDGSSQPADWDADGIYDSTDMQLYGAATQLGRLQWLGGIYISQGVPNNIFIRGWRAADSSNTGIFTLNLTHISTQRYRTLGFRCAK